MLMTACDDDDDDDEDDDDDDDDDDEDGDDDRIQSIEAHPSLVRFLNLFCSFIHINGDSVLFVAKIEVILGKNFVQIRMYNVQCTMCKVQF